jgi:hypothetical protein
MGLLKTETEKGICQPNCWSNYWVEFGFEIAALNLPACFSCNLAHA